MQTTPHLEIAAPGQAPNIRIIQLDILRGYALLGIFWINVIVFGLPVGIYSVPGIIGTHPELNIAFWAFSELMVEGTMRGLFSILFGASALLFLDEVRLANQGLAIVDRFYRRNILLILFGLLHAYFLLWPYDVLYAYGLIGMFLFPLRKIKAKTLFIIGVIVLLIGEYDIRDVVQNFQQQENISISNEYNSQPAASSEIIINHTGIDSDMRHSILLTMNEDIEDHMLGYFDLLLDNIDAVMLEETVKMYTTYIFDIGGMMLIGMALFKLGILSGAGSRRFYLLLMISGYGVGLFFRSLSVIADIKAGFNPELAMQHASINYTIGRLPITLGHIGLIALLCRIRLFDGINQAIAKVGRMALTNYIMQSVISIFLFYGFGLALYGTLEHYELIYVCLAVWIFQIGFSVIWFRYFKQGPLEWVWRSLIYGQRQALRKVVSAT